MITQCKYNEETKKLEYDKSTPKVWAQDVLMDIISQYNYRLEDRLAYNKDRMTTKEYDQCYKQLQKQADRIAKMFGFNNHWVS